MGFTHEELWLGFRCWSFRSSRGKQGLEFLEEERVEGGETGEEGLVEEEDFEGDFGEQSFGNKDFFFFGREVGADFGGDCGVGADFGGDGGVGADFGGDGGVDF